MRGMKSVRTWLLCGVGATVGVGGAAHAQVEPGTPEGAAVASTPEPEQASPTTVAPADAPPLSDESGQIVVTARRTLERLQDVPVAVAAFGAAALEERRIVSEVDLQIATPGLTVRQTGSSDQLNFAIRGQSIDAFSNSAPAVVTYFNDVPAGGGTSTAFFDLASIQVLKGPQGTLFGRNATGGAVLYSTAAPTNRSEGYLEVGYGNYDNREIEGAINLPFADGFAVRVAGLHRNREGFQRNLLDGTRANSIDANVGRISLLVEPPESRFRNVAVLQAGRFRGRTGATKISNANGVNGTPATYFDPITGTTQPLVTNFRDVYGIGGPGAGVVPGFSSLNDFLIKQQDIGFYEFFGNQNSKRRGSQLVATNTTTFELTDDITIKNILGYNRVKTKENSDIDGSPFQFLLIGGGPTERDSGYTFETEQYSEELQLTGETGPFTYIFGGFLAKDAVGNNIPLRVTPDLGGPFLGAYDFTITYKSKALYGQVTYAITERLNLSAGIRYTIENVSIRQADRSLLAVVNAGDRRRKDSKPSWLVGLDYRVNDDLLVYFNHRGSWRTGGFNGTSAASFPDAATFKPETTYDFEFGAKFAGRLGTVPARLNLAIFDQYIKDVQRAPYLNISALAGNVNKARVSGFEADANIDILPWLELGGAVSYTDARFTDPRATVAGASFIFGPYADTPELSGSAFFRAATELAADAGEIALRGEYYGQKSFFFSNLNNTIVPNARIPGYYVLNARVEWNRILGSRISAAGFISNLTDEEYLVGGFPLGAVTGANSVLPGTPRTYGVEVGIKF